VRPTRPKTRPPRASRARRARRALLAALAALALAALLAPAAGASTVSLEPSGALVVTAGAERNDIGLQEYGGGDGRLVIYDGVPGNAMVSATGACEEAWEGAALCNWSPSAGVRVDLGGGNDEGYVSFGLPANAVFSIAGGSGDDILQASLDGQATTLDGGPGKDVLKAGPAPTCCSAARATTRSTATPAATSCAAKRATTRSPATATRAPTPT
jgi:hypothetical protein